MPKSTTPESRASRSSWLRASTDLGPPVEATAGEEGIELASTDLRPPLEATAGEEGIVLASNQ